MAWGPDPKVVVHAVELRALCFLVNSKVHAKQYDFAKDIAQRMGTGDSAFADLGLPSFAVGYELEWRFEEFLEEGEPFF